jgi:ectoine hydroxylase-related dioxygenase (phytanoyl-CoA dioxygenase family)
MPHPILTREQRDLFWRNGYLVIEDVIDARLTAILRADLEAWSKGDSEKKSSGGLVNGGFRFDVIPGHSASEPPALRMINSPVEVSEAYYHCMADSRMTDMVADLIGPDVKYYHSKIDLKLPGTATEVKWHQDFLFTPHSNDDIVTALLFLDDVTSHNGPPEVAPGTHKGEIHSLWRNGKFAAAVNDAVAAESRKKAVKCIGGAGSCCFMHTRLLHSSSSNRSDQPRTLFTSVYTAEDAIPLSPNPLPSRFEGLIVRGRQTNRARSMAFELELPQKHWDDASSAQPQAEVAGYHF